MKHFYFSVTWINLGMVQLHHVTSIEISGDAAVIVDFHTKEKSVISAEFIMEIKREFVILD